VAPKRPGEANIPKRTSSASIGLEDVLKLPNPFRGADQELRLCCRVVLLFFSLPFLVSPV
jgi:hypothetical protein